MEALLRTLEKKMITARLGRKTKTPNKIDLGVSFLYFCPPMSPALESKGAWNPEVCTRDGEKELQENLPLSGLRMRRGTINIRESGGNPTYFQLFPLPPPHLRGNPMVVVVPTMAAEAEQAPKTLREGNPFLWSKRLWSQEPRKNLRCFFISV